MLSSTRASSGSSGSRETSFIAAVTMNVRWKPKRWMSRPPSAALPDQLKLFTDSRALKRARSRLGTDGSQATNQKILDLQQAIVFNAGPERRHGVVAGLS